jgi:hypothetical protein
MPPQCDYLDMNMKGLIFFGKAHEFFSVEIFIDNHLEKKTFYLIHTYKSTIEIWAMCTQLDLEVMCSRPK